MFIMRYDYGGIFPIRIFLLWIIAIKTWIWDGKEMGRTAYLVRCDACMEGIFLFYNGCCMV